MRSRGPRVPLSEVFGLIGSSSVRRGHLPLRNSASGSSRTIFSCFSDRRLDHPSCRGIFASAQQAALASSSSTIHFSSSRCRRVGGVRCEPWLGDRRCTRVAVNVRFETKDSNLHYTGQSRASYRWTSLDQVPSERVELSPLRLKGGCATSYATTT